jgi:hypothetical protein
MSALPHEPPYQSARLAPTDGPQTLAELRAALASTAPADLVTFDARLAGAQLAEVPAVIGEYRAVLALRTRPEVAAAVAASMAGTAQLRPAHEVLGSAEGAA